MIYFIKFHSTGHIKIGFTQRTPSRRFAEHRRILGSFDILGVMDGFLKEEMELCSLFQDLKVYPDSPKSEFFHDNLWLRAYIDRETHKDTKRYIIREKRALLRMKKDLLKLSNPEIIP